MNNPDKPHAPSYDQAFNQLPDLTKDVAQAISTGAVKLCNPTTLQALEIDGIAVVEAWQQQSTLPEQTTTEPAARGLAAGILAVRSVIRTIGSKVADLLN
jgi:hypothetical protein